MKNKFFRGFQVFFKRKFRKVAHQAGKAVNQEIDEIIDKTLSHQEMEALIVRAVEKLILRLFRKYSLIIIGVIISLFTIQLAVLNLSIKSIETCHIL
ncbi:hypothetical protein PCC7424_1329 [Gloeothece citriformis PCC 7424]|uniref:Uncharacterized protein n=1 Tax=Gloeothece citriformis (strain PCC 7424) TaxID=65393 RepID=B7K7K6_GLOC7|nr:hypothetical protein [Gloeothece citriformis]ACK69774.1 hypothetical protein PCC7424_1329 [Gloeothece citriformis PCC 7424]